jgi:hypothetical protein
MLPSQHRILMTGTPIVNSLKEMWVLFERACKGQLLGADYKKFKQEYEDCIVAGYVCSSDVCARLSVQQHAVSHTRATASRCDDGAATAQCHTPALLATREVDARCVVASARTSIAVDSERECVAAADRHVTARVSQKRLCRLAAIVTATTQVVRTHRCGVSSGK